MKKTKKSAEEESAVSDVFEQAHKLAKQQLSNLPLDKSAESKLPFGHAYPKVEGERWCRYCDCPYRYCEC